MEAERVHERITFTKSLSLRFFKGSIRHAMAVPKSRSFIKRLPLEASSWFFEKLSQEASLRS